MLRNNILKTLSERSRYIIGVFTLYPPYGLHTGTALVSNKGFELSIDDLFDLKECIEIYLSDYFDDNSLDDDIDIQSIYLHRYSSAEYERLQELNRSI